MNDTQEKYTKMFLSGPILGPLVRFALPLMLSLLLQALYGGVDLAVVGQFSPTASVSAVATGSQVMQSVTVLITGLTMGVTVLLGKAVGANDAKAAGEVVSGQIRLFTIVAAALTFVMLLLAPAGGPTDECAGRSPAGNGALCAHLFRRDRFHHRV